MPVSAEVRSLGFPNGKTLEIINMSAAEKIKDGKE
jgi:hypothetical protein